MASGLGMRANRVNVSLTPELERLVIEKVESGVYQTASEVVGEALRLLKERDQAREQLRADVQAGFDQFASSEGRTYDMISGRQLAGRISRAVAQLAPRSRRCRIGCLAEQDLEALPTVSHLSPRRYDLFEQLRELSALFQRLMQERAAVFQQALPFFLSQPTGENQPADQARERAGCLLVARPF